MQIGLKGRRFLQTRIYLRKRNLFWETEPILSFKRNQQTGSAKVWIYKHERLRWEIIWSFSIGFLSLQSWIRQATDFSPAHRERELGLRRCEIGYFTLLMTDHCDSNPAQYERNRRFGHLVHVPARVGDGAKLPSVEFVLNAFMVLYFLVKGSNYIPWSFESRRSQNNVTLHATIVELTLITVLESTWSCVSKLWWLNKALICNRHNKWNLPLLQRRRGKRRSWKHKNQNKKSTTDQWAYSQPYPTELTN